VDAGEEPNVYLNETTPDPVDATEPNPGKVHPRVKSSRDWYRAATGALLKRHLSKVVDKAEDDEKTTDLLRRTFPKWIFYFLRFFGAIGHERDCCYFLSRSFWLFCISLMIYAAIFLCEALYFHYECMNDKNCILQKGNKSQSAETNAVAEYGAVSVIAMVVEIVGDVISIILLHFWLHYVFYNTRSFQTLLHRENSKIFQGLDTWCLMWLVFFVIFLFLGVYFYIILQVFQKKFSKPVAAFTVTVYCTSILVSCSISVGFFVVMCLLYAVYDEWSKEMLKEKTILELNNDATFLRTPTSKSLEVKLLRKLIPRVVLSAKVTMNMRYLLIPTLLYFVTFAVALHDVFIDVTLEKLLFLLVERLILLLIKTPPVIIAFMVSSRSSDLEFIVSQLGLRKISEYLRNAASKWMVTRTIALDWVLLSQLSFLVGLVGFSKYFLETSREALVQPWDARYERFGTCTDGIRSGIEQHIDCGDPDSGCPQTCRQKYGEYILIPGDRECTQVDGYDHITTQRACTLAYNSWSRLNKMTTGPLTRVYLDTSWEDPKSIKISRDKTRPYHPFNEQIVDHHLKKIDNWTDTFSCGAFSMPQMTALITGRLNYIPLSMANDQRVSFPAMFSTGHKSVDILGLVYEKPIAHLCYAGTGCQAGSDKVHGARFQEQMPCPGSCSSCGRDNASAWQTISAPMSILQNKLTELEENKLTDVVQFRASRDQKSDCAEIKVDNSMHMGAQVVFTLAREAFHGGDHRNYSAGADVRPFPKNVSVAVTSGRSVRSAVLVFPTANMTIGQRYGLGSEIEFVEVLPDSTLVLVVDHRSDLKSVKLCFDRP